ncbi:Uncharacterised protein [Pseudomonas luteola]|uniref:Uncharacterized protein n=1 Tax=Pseudomonas luteola TaxID=47886 RepID=A0A2X2C984_PSELU|nr:hypothetical protein [Pseudomonas luteola]SPZ02306.1 Uncharacterised protein [Pseudomonas luteola]
MATKIADLRMQIVDKATGEIFFDETSESAEPAAFMFFGGIYAREMGYSDDEVFIIVDMPRFLDFDGPDDLPF